MYDVLHGYKLKTENDAFGHFLITVSFQDVYFVEMCRLANWEFLKFFFYYCFFLKCLFFFCGAASVSMQHSQAQGGNLRGEDEEQAVQSW